MIGRVNGYKYIFLGTFATEVQAALAYDQAAIRFRGKKVRLLTSDIASGCMYLN